jgi:hypothetical protein
MAHPLAVDGAIQFADRSLGRAESDFLTPSTRVSVFTRTHRSTLPALPCSSGICQWDGTSITSASGKRVMTCRPRGEFAAAGSA